MAARKHNKTKLHQKRSGQILPGLLLIVVAVGLLGLVVKVSLSQADRGNSSSLSLTSDGADERWAYIMTDLIGQTRHFKGSTDAPVTILEFSNFQWPYCRQYATDVGRQVEKQYIQTGKVRFGYLHFTILGSESVLAAQASECAADQGQFWGYHDSLFENQAGKNKGGFGKDNLKRFASEIGLNSIIFDECLDSNSYTSIIQEQTGYASSLGFQGTPAFLINGKPLVGAQTFEQFQKYIEEALHAVVP